jgi:hypothetical protein
MAKANVQYDLQMYPYLQALELLKTEGYHCRTENISEDAKYFLIIVCGGDDIPEDAVLEREKGFDVNTFKCYRDVDEELGVISCGGHYTCVAVYELSEGEYYAFYHGLTTSFYSGCTPIS